MQTTDLEPVAEAHLAKDGKRSLKLVIGNKNYSTWSMRPWLVLKAFHIPFEEVLIALDRPDTGSKIAEFTAAGRVPVLIDHETSIWDSLAICEYLAEQFPERGLWPAGVTERAIARSICAEMHSGFTGLRTAMWMNIRARFPGRGRTPEAQADIGRISEIWEDCFARVGPHRFLFGDFSIADAFYAPVVMRFISYDVALAPALEAYVERVAAHPAVAEWIRDALAETHRAPKYDVYPE